MDIFVNPITLSFLWWFIVSLISFLLGLLLGWLLWYHYRKTSLELGARVKDLERKNVDLEADLNSWKYKFEELEKDCAERKTSLARCEADKQILEFKLKKCEEGGGGSALGAVASGGITTKSTGIDYTGIFGDDNLQIVEGIGPKIESVLKDSDIGNWKALASTKAANIKDILVAKNPNYRIHDPETWPQQAGMALKDNWEELVVFQKQLGGGEKDKGDGDTPSKVQRLAMKILGFSDNPEDLKIVEGVGPKIEQLLKAGGINNWEQLAGAAVSTIQGILDAAGGKYRLATPDTWPQQASLAAQGKWSELSEYQDRLKGGKDVG